MAFQTETKYIHFWLTPPPPSTFHTLLDHPPAPFEGVRTLWMPPRASHAQNFVLKMIAFTTQFPKATRKEPYLSSLSD